MSFCWRHMQSTKISHTYLIVCIKCLSYRALYLTMSKKFKCFILNSLYQQKKYSKTCVKWPLSKRPKICFQLLLNAGQKYCRMLQREHLAILTTFIKLPFFNLFCLFLSGCLHRFYCIL